MKRSTFHALAAAGLACAGLAAPEAGVAVTKVIELPADGLVLQASDLPGYALAREHCQTCHSAEYMAYQPPNAGRPYWEATVQRMRKVFHAPVPEEDVPAIVDYLSATYGSRNGAPR